MVVTLGGMSRKPYPSDLTDAQWDELAPLLPPDTTRGHPRTTRREVVNGILYVLAFSVATGASDGNRCHYRHVPCAPPRR